MAKHSKHTKLTHSSLNDLQTSLNILQVYAIQLPFILVNVAEEVTVFLKNGKNLPFATSIPWLFP